MGQSFSERHGFKTVRYEVQINDFDDDTRVAIWNTYYEHLQYLLGSNEPDLHRTLTRNATYYWTKFLRKDLDQFTDYAGSIWFLKGVLTKGQFWESLDFIEMVAQERLLSSRTARFLESMNSVFEDHLVGYRIVGEQVVALDNRTEVEAVGEALEAVSTEPLSGVRHGLENAIRLFSDRRKPDFPNSVKESISAVEGMVRHITGKTKFSDGLAELQKKGVEVPTEIRRAWGTLYGWASQEDGVRHAATALPTVDRPAARFMLVACSAFVTYLVDKSGSAG